MLNKKAVMEFSWVFAVIVGAMILFFAFYFVGTNLLSKQYERATVEAHSLDVILNPFSQFGELKALDAKPVALPQKSVVEFSCQESTTQSLGTNEIKIISKGEAGIPRVVYDKYIFAEANLETRKFQALSVPFEMPWRVAELIILWPYDKNYCFLSAPQFVKDSLGNETSAGLNISSIYFDSCPENSIRVCFQGGSNCDVQVSGASQHKGSTYKKDSGSTIYFVSDALMYASIFSDKEIYNCNLKRLAFRLYLETSIYEEKNKALAQKGCSVYFNLAPLKQVALELSSSVSESKLNQLWQIAQQIKRQNEMAHCSLF
ncbi:MAG: hypothetical protein N3G19_02880 [Candidatus Pacearchaeota archaeon]|nr:hypothetical protein [Candidatus Pacearchaeota archaeon]